MGLYSEVFSFWDKDKLKKYMGLCLGGFFYACSICCLYLAGCTFAPISKFGPLAFKNPRCTPGIAYYLNFNLTHIIEKITLENDEYEGPQD